MIDIDPSLSEWHGQIVQAFSETMNAAGMERNSEVTVSSGVDPTVRFIGSHISPLKPRIEEGLPQNGIYAVQPCVRTQNLRLLTDNEQPMAMWGSYFVSLGAVTRPSEARDLAGYALHFLAEAEIDPERVIVRVSSHDEDLLAIATELVPSRRIEVNTRLEKYYRHVIGMDGIVGRNFNLALMGHERDPVLAKDIGNIIIFSRDGEDLFGELALGASTIVAHAARVKTHPLECYMPAITPTLSDEVPRDLRLKLADATLVSLVLTQEGLEPSNRTNMARLLTKYMRAAAGVMDVCHLSEGQVSELLAHTTSPDPAEVTVRREKAIAQTVERIVSYRQ